MDTYTSLSERINNPSKYGMSIIFIVHNVFYYCWRISISLAKISFGSLVEGERERGKTF